MKKELNEKLFSEKQAADYFGWSVFTMREIRKRGEIECLIFQDKTIRYTIEQLEKYKNEHLVRSEKSMEQTPNDFSKGVISNGNKENQND